MAGVPYQRLADTFTLQPQKMSLMNLDQATTLEAMYNPMEWSQVVEAVYAEQTVVGLSHEPAHYINTKSVPIEFSLLFTAESKREKTELDHAARWLESCLYTWRGYLRPPRVLFSWPTEASLTCNIRTLHLSRKRFNVAAQIVELEAKLTLKEVRDVRLWGDDVLAKGLQRSPGPVT